MASDRVTLQEIATLATAALDDRTNPEGQKDYGSIAIIGLILGTVMMAEQHGMLEELYHVVTDWSHRYPGIFPADAPEDESEN